MLRKQEARLGDDLLHHLPADRRPSVSFALPSVAVHTIAGLSVVRDASDRLGTTVDDLLLTAFAVLLARLAGQQTVEIRGLVPIPVLRKWVFEDEASFRSLLAAARGDAADAGRPTAVEFLRGAEKSSPVDASFKGLRMAVRSCEASYQVQLSSFSGLFGQSTLELWLRHYEGLLRALCDAPDSPSKLLPFYKPQEALRFYQALNDTAVAGSDPQYAHELVVWQAARTPDALAVAFGSESLTYRQLDERSKAVAVRLQALGAGPNRPIAICMERMALLPAMLLGILRSGSCYVPLDQRESPERLKAILQECRPVAMIVDRSVDQSVLELIGSGAIPMLRPEDLVASSANIELREIEMTPEALAYIIYTSGTTGKPKGVMIQHRALCNLLSSMMRLPGCTAQDRMLAISPISFDIATMDMFLPLVAGGTLVIADRFVAADPSRLSSLLKDFDITILQATPSTWQLLASSDWEGKRSLKMITGGEALSRGLADQLLRKGGELWNCYGPTETTIYSSVLRVRDEPGPVTVTIGPPMANTTYYVMDEAGHVLPPGMPGELYIGGMGVSLGYVDKTQDTKRFLPDPYSQISGSRLFRSGDLVRLVHGDEFEFLGRLDHQVKLRGYRIELGEIEAALRSFPGIQNAVAALSGNETGEPHMVAYFTADHEPPDLEGLRHHLARLLPDYMVPSRFLLMDAIPLTRSGKIDRQALSAHASSAVDGYRKPKAIPPGTKLEEKLLAIFSSVLDVGEFGVTDSFFAYGGYSLLTVKLFTRINRALNLSLPISLLYDAPTVRSLARLIDRPEPLPSIVRIRPHGRSAPLFVIHSYLLYEVLPQMVEPDRPVYGLRELPEGDQVQTVEDRAAMYVNEILKVSPSGPFMLVGWCAAGSLTVEVARLLRKLHHEVGLVALFDAERPGYRPKLDRATGTVLAAKMRFHGQRIRSLSIREKVAYLCGACGHFWDRMLESLFMRHRGLLLGLQRVFGFSLPKAVFNNTWSRIAAIQIDAPAGYPGNILLFRATDVPQLPGADETMGWNDVVDDVEVILVPGDHESMFQEPHVQHFSRHLRQAIQLAEKGVTFSTC
jgi:amino acid adenylation domain-containing protein